MYTPKYAENTDIHSIRQFIKQNSFGIVVSHSQHKLLASHVPLEFSKDESKLVGHLSRANSQWKSFLDRREVLAIFTGPHAYISSSWYDHENVPTWNYLAVHVYGTIRIVEDFELYDSLKSLVDRHEKTSQRPISLEGMSPDYLSKSLKGIIGFEISISNMEASHNLSQNRDKKNQLKIIDELQKRHDPLSEQIASEMKKNITHE